MEENSGPDRDAGLVAVFALEFDQALALGPGQYTIFRENPDHVTQWLGPDNRYISTYSFDGGRDSLPSEYKDNYGINVPSRELTVSTLLLRPRPNALLFSVVCLRCHRLMRLLLCVVVVQERGLGCVKKKNFSSYSDALPYTTYHTLHATHPGTTRCSHPYSDFGVSHWIRHFSEFNAMAV